MKKCLLKCIGLLIGLVFVFSLIPHSAADVVWDDDFNDGDHDGWTEIIGTWDVDPDGLWLENLYVDDIHQRIAHPSSQVVGTWKFDHYHADHHVNEHTTVWFITNGTDTPDENYGYGLRMRESNIYLIKLVGAWEVSYPLSGGGYTSDEPYELTWTHYEITRNSTGGFNVYINSTSTSAEPDITAVDETYSYSERFLIDYNGIYSTRIDNITIDNELPPEPTSPTDTTPTDTTPTNGGTTLPIDMILLIAGAGVAVVVIVAAVVFMRRR